MAEPHPPPLPAPPDVPATPPAPASQHRHLPLLIARSGEGAEKGFVEFFAATLRNPNTRRAYARSVNGFCTWCAENGLGRLADVETIHVATWIEARTRQVSAPSVKQDLAALRRLFDWLVVRQVIPANPAQPVAGPAHSAATGKTPVLSTEQARLLLRSIPANTLSGLRDRALIALMIYTFARVGAALALDVNDLFRESHRLNVRLREKGGKHHRMPCHHRLEAWLGDYMSAVGFGDELHAPLFQTITRQRGRPPRLSGRRLNRHEAWAMVRRRARQAGIDTPVSCHTFRGTGITAYLEHPDAKLEEAQKMAGHTDPKTTRLYDRRSRAVSLDEVERIRI